ncbi:hypothetical protein KSP39_PZI004124 [Platanthera zijinensis]|uniref:Uncharacterized protein n=1 Tax=Platanthera zijinensis TaxID=2320716 RepID=A0AAP0GDC5_9ASPA
MSSEDSDNAIEQYEIARRKCHACRDPKDGELCLSGAKPEETLVEARSDTDVQIVRLTWDRRVERIEVCTNRVKRAGGRLDNHSPPKVTQAS